MGQHSVRQVQVLSAPNLMKERRSFRIINLLYFFNEVFLAQFFVFLSKILFIFDEGKNRHFLSLLDPIDLFKGAIPWGPPTFNP